MSRPASLPPQAIASIKAPLESSLEAPASSLDTVSAATSFVSADTSLIAPVRLPPRSAESRISDAESSYLIRLSTILGTDTVELNTILDSRFNLDPSDIFGAITVPGITIDQQKELLERYIAGDDLSDESGDDPDIAKGYGSRYGGEEVLNSREMLEEKEEIIEQLRECERKIEAFRLEELESNLALIQRKFEDHQAEIKRIEQEIHYIEDYTAASAIVKEEKESLLNSLEESITRSRSLIADLEKELEEVEEVRKCIGEIEVNNIGPLYERLEDIEQIVSRKSAGGEDDGFFEGRGGSPSRWFSKRGVGGFDATATAAAELEEEEVSRKRSRYFSRFGSETCPTTVREQALVEETLLKSLESTSLVRGDTFKVLDVGGGGGRFYKVLSDFFHKHLEGNGIKLEIISYDIVGIDDSYAALLVENGFRRKEEAIADTAFAIEEPILVKSSGFNQVPREVSDRGFLDKKNAFVSYSKRPIGEIETSLGAVQDLGSFISKSDGIMVKFINGPAIPRGRDIPARVVEVTTAVKNILGQDHGNEIPVVDASMSMFGSIAHIMNPRSREGIFGMMHDVTKGYVCLTMPTRRAHPFVVAAANLRRLIAPVKHGRDSKNFPGEAKYTPTDADATTKPPSRFPYWHSSDVELLETFVNAGFKGDNIHIIPASYTSPVHLIGNKEESIKDDAKIEEDLGRYKALSESGNEEGARRQWDEIMDKSSYLEIRAQGLGVDLELTRLEGVEAMSALVSEPATSPVGGVSASTLADPKSRDGRSS